MLFAIGMLLVVAFILFIMYARERVSGGTHTSHGRGENALEILKRRYARGELTTEQYREMRDTLKPPPPPPAAKPPEHHA